ncbi:PhzF family phenazine biosynthesis protein [Pseudobacteriovorax antillogorgiicola]|uniref:Phenazine biosynthesis protein PhzF family n=1 Tax=Pseudobacteriovorax antillogorgiicola TaxID=1513793 RepID=A0A1Y6CEC0_9BACT|nr:PhzF family phenazine biosynthesis isomerase [Pseudobacteriovorax antillogorgiicola]TCS49097.1 PhzF family phenazine biosynthesis protein [Pseudobacteriovorax antillogorgiicola]SMF51765.1 phenazine biosynthesis protein PhzF family [Pseudobacteriovorax antillogorgiicola]
MYEMFQVDAFASEVFSGNPAAVVPLRDVLDDAICQKIAEENNLAETAFVRMDSKTPSIRWFTPTEEVDLCGHATLASAWTLIHKFGWQTPIYFSSRSGTLTVHQKDLGWGADNPLVMDFPAIPSVQGGADLRDRMGQHLQLEVEEVHTSEQDLMVVLGSADQIAKLRVPQPCETLGHRGLIVTAVAEKHSELDFVSRCFYPDLGIQEDAVTGSAHCQLAYYWSKRLGRNSMRARQLSRRGGNLILTVEGGRVHMEGTAKLFMEAKITVGR